jgi:hypothetical protein
MNCFCVTEGMITQFYYVWLHTHDVGYSYYTFNESDLNWDIHPFADIRSSMPDRGIILFQFEDDEQ